MKFNCKCSSGKRSCLHKCITKWALAQWNPQLLESVPPSTSADKRLDEEVFLLEDEEEEDPEITASTSVSGPFYPPVAECAIRMTEYIFDNKKIPAQLPLSLTVEKNDYLKRLVGFCFVFFSYYTCQFQCQWDRTGIEWFSNAICQLVNLLRCTYCLNSLSLLVYSWTISFTN